LIELNAKAAADSVPNGDAGQDAKGQDGKGHDVYSVKKSLMSE